MRKLSSSFLVLCVLTSCVSQKKTVTPATSVNSDIPPRFIENISIQSERKKISSVEQSPDYSISHVKAVQKNDDNNLHIEKRNALQFKYAILLNLPVETELNEKLLEFIDTWYGTPYQYGGTSRRGVDCSAFAAYFMSSVYGLTIPRNSKDQYSYCKKIKKSKLEEGDLVFFNTRGGISHVGVYIGNNKFAHASTSSGVTISDLDDDYYERRYVASGRVR